jgi:para-aminobenzoate synthetase component 1
LRTIVQKNISNVDQFKSQILNWSSDYREVVFLNSNSDYNSSQKYADYEFILAVDAFTSIKTDYFNAFQDLNQYQKQTQDWLFGYLTYDLKNTTEKLESNNDDFLEFPDLFFFQPKKLFLYKNGILEMHYLRFCDDEIESDFEEINKFTFNNESDVNETLIIQAKINKPDYIDKIEQTIADIQLGSIYEANFCMEFFSDNAKINPIATYQNLNKISNPPFSVFFKNNLHFALSASPERYLKKIENKIISQPIKGTSKRFVDKDLDEKSKTDLQNNPKERSENIMIVDLVRNDLSKTAKKGSVQVEELCAVYSYQQVHHLVSTITSEMVENLSPVEAIQSTFPMGSMTGAPKIAAMQIMEDLEETKRGLYSGSIGYFTPTGDFDFNVVIRSILYNQKNNYLSFSVGSAITALSEPEKEYQECFLKAKALFQALNSPYDI